MGKAIENVLNEAFGASRGARINDESVQQSMVVIVTGNATDDVEEVKKKVTFITTATKFFLQCLSQTVLVHM